MRIIKISPSSFNKWDECQHKYFLEYILGFKTVANKAADFGSCFHRIMEYFAQIKKSIQDKTYEVNKFNLQTSYTDISEVDYLTISRHIYDDYIKTSTFEFTEEDFVKIVHGVETILSSTENPLKLDIHDTEHYFSLEIDEPWAKYEYLSEDGKIKGKLKINGIVDLIVKEDNNILRIIDYKTGSDVDFFTKAKKDYDYLQKDIQLNIYYYCLKKLYPEYNDFVLTMNHIYNSGPIHLSFNEENYNKTAKKIKQRFEEIRNTNLPTLNHHNSVNRWRCKMCPFSKMELHNAPYEFRKYQINKPGEKMCACSQIYVECQTKGIDKVTDIYNKKVDNEGNSIRK